MGYSRRRAEQALSHLDFPDANAAIEWIANH